MKIALAQIKPLRGDITGNYQKHKEWIVQARYSNADLIVFPELSLSGYEPSLARELALEPQAKVLDELESLASIHRLTIAVGFPLLIDEGLYIAMGIFQPDADRQLYAKQYLHEDEKTYFLPGKKQIIFRVKGYRIAPAICYEALQEKHSQRVFLLGADIYIASVAKPQRGIDKAYQWLPVITKKYSVPVLMVNSIGCCDNFLSAGQSAIWQKGGALQAQLNSRDEALLFYQTNSTFESHITND